VGQLPDLSTGLTVAEDAGPISYMGVPFGTAKMAPATPFGLCLCFHAPSTFPNISEIALLWALCCSFKSNLIQRLYDISPVPAFRSISRAIDDWLEAMEPVRTTPYLPVQADFFKPGQVRRKGNRLFGF
jgi:hypothetical protein